MAESCADALRREVVVCDDVGKTFGSQMETFEKKLDAEHTRIGAMVSNILLELRLLSINGGNASTKIGSVIHSVNGSVDSLDTDQLSHGEILRLFPLKDSLSFEFQIFSAIPTVKGSLKKISLRLAPHEPHFVKPILHGFHTGLDIPLTFFANHLEGKMNKTSWKLRSDASDKTWEVIQEGTRLTRGWETFARAHDLRVGDIVIFKKEAHMVFHVTPIGPSCCEIRYTPPHVTKEEASSHDAAGGSGARADFISFEYCFLVEVTDKNLEEDILLFPAAATQQCSVLNKQCQEVILVNKEGNSWIANLLFCESKTMYYIRGGWRKFCCDNKYDIASLLVFNVVGDGKTAPLLCVCSESEEIRQLLKDWLSRKSG